MMKLYKIPLQKLNPVTQFQPRGLAQHMSYRYYPSWSTHTIVLFHGLVSSSIYLSPLAHRIAERKIAQVIIPDWRGHGEDKRSLEDFKPQEIIQDFEEMLIHFKSRTAMQRISMLGHSFGARWMIKVLLESKLKFDNCYLVAPYLKEAQLKPHWLEKGPELYKVNWPEGVGTGKERFEYPKSFLDSFNLDDKNMEQALQKSKIHMIEAGLDEILKPLANSIISDATHMGIVMEAKNIDLICDLIENFTLT